MYVLPLAIDAMLVQATVTQSAVLHLIPGAGRLDSLNECIAHQYLTLNDSDHDKAVIARLSLLDIVQAILVSYRFYDYPVVLAFFETPVRR